ncbi:TPA: hypothetical protein L1A35_003947 [Escherichia coli]|nr:hypothetical protein [Escherichia coli]
MNTQEASDLIARYEHNVLIVGNSVTQIDRFFKRYYMPDSKYYDFSQASGDGDLVAGRNDYAVSVVRDALNSEEHVIIFNCVGWPDLGEGSAILQFAMTARKLDKQLIVAVHKRAASGLKCNFRTVGKLTGKDNIVVVSCQGSVCPCHQPGG